MSPILLEIHTLISTVSAVLLLKQHRRINAWQPRYRVQDRLNWLMSIVTITARCTPAKMWRKKLLFLQYLIKVKISVKWANYRQKWKQNTDSYSQNVFSWLNSFKIRNLISDRKPLITKMQTFPSAEHPFTEFQIPSTKTVLQKMSASPIFRAVCLWHTVISRNVLFNTLDLIVITAHPYCRQLSGRNSATHLGHENHCEPSSVFNTSVSFIDKSSNIIKY